MQRGGEMYAPGFNTGCSLSAARIQGERHETVLVVGITAAALAAPVSIALGAVLSAPLPPPVVIPPYNWTGFYVGANLGGGWAGGNITDVLNGVSFGTGTGGAFIGGGQIGYNYQISPNLVLGVEWLMDGVSNDNGSNIAFIPAIRRLFPGFREYGLDHDSYRSDRHYRTTMGSLASVR